MTQVTRRKPQAAELVLALDVDTLPKARYFVKALHSKVKIFKAGLQLFTGYGPKIVELIKRQGAEVFLDLKLYDIPNTVANAVCQAVRLEVKMLTLHIQGGPEMLKAAVQAAGDESVRLKVRRPLLIGVTVLTSKNALPGQVLELAREGLACGLDGVVCSPLEAALLRKELGSKFVIITPGIRPDSASADDQKRTATVSQAIKAGSDFLVVGRPILQAEEPLRAAEDIITNIRR